jgi:ubiquinone/menaquinone biosynthesis C-methylase UbiE
MKRVFDPGEPEIMDRPQSLTGEFELALTTRRKLNRCLGITRLLRCFLRSWIEPDRVHRILDLATGDGDAARAIVQWARKRRIAVKVDAVDSRPALLEIARRRNSDCPEISFIRANAAEFAGGECYDMVCCVNALRDFSEADAVRLLRRAGELSHDKVVIADLDRDMPALAAVYVAAATVFQGAAGRNAARHSLRKSFTFAELDELARRAGWQNYGHRHFLPASQAVWICKREPQPVMDGPLPEPGFAA